MVSDEQIVAAVMECGTIRAAAAAVGVTERTIYTRMQEDDFRALYQAAKADALRATVTALKEKTGRALNVIGEIMDDQEASPAIRLQAANSILTHAEKIAGRLNETEDAERRARDACEASDFMKEFSFSWGK